jgi:CRP/FNR family transcriptional regulator
MKIIKSSYHNLYSLLNINQLLWINLCSIGVIEQFKKNAEIFAENSNADFVYIVIEGCICLYSKTSIVDLVTYGDSIGTTINYEEESDHSQEYPLNAKAITPSKLLKIPIKMYNQLIYTNPECARYTMIQFRKKMNFIQNMKCFEKYSVEVRLANFLLKKTELLSTNLLTKKIIGQCTGMSCETVIRQLSVWRKKNIIEISSKKIKINNIIFLEKLISF